MKRYATVGFLLGAAILTNAGIASAQRWGREATPRAGACFYEDINFGGRYFCTAAGATAEVPSGTNDKISSIRLFGNTEVMVFRDPNFRGSSKDIVSDVRDLRGMGFNDRISSYQVVATRGLDRRADQRGVQNGNGTWQGGGQSNQRNYRAAETVVRRSYQTVLGREPDPTGLRSWTEQVLNNNWTERDLENALRQSDEYRDLRNSRRRR